MRGQTSRTGTKTLGTVHVHLPPSRQDDVRIFYELPDALVERLRKLGDAFSGEPIDGLDEALVRIVLEIEP